MEDLMIIERRGAIVVSSRTVAERFGKQHKNVLRDISNILGGLLKIEQTYFIESHYFDEQNGQKYPEYLMNRDGFALLAMGFTGQKALEWKVKYIQTFNLMEDALRERQSSEWLITRKQGKLIRRDETDVIAELIGYAEEQGSQGIRKHAYTNYTKLVNSLVGIEAGERDRAPFKTVMVIGMLEDMIMHTVREDMVTGVYYKEIYRHCKANGEQMMKFAYLPKLTA